VALVVAGLVMAGVVTWAVVARPAPGRSGSRPTTPRVAPTAPAPQVFVPPAGIAGDCSVDVAPALRSWIWSLPAGTPSRPVTIEFPPSACYRVDESLYLRGLTDVTIDGRGATFRQESPQVAEIGPLPTDHPYCGSSLDTQSGTTVSVVPVIWWFEGGCDLTVTDMQIVGPDVGGVVGSENDSGIELSGVQRVTLSHLGIKDVDGDFVTLTGLHEGSAEVAGGEASDPTVDATIRGSTFVRSGRQGITPQYVNGVTISGNTFTGVGATAIDLEADTTGGCACDVTVDNNTFDGPAPYLVAGITGLSIERFTFSGNTLRGGAQLRIQLAPALASSDIAITGNAGSTASTWPWPSVGIGFSVRGDSAGPVTGVTVSDNTVPAPAGGQPFVRSGTQASDVTVRGNTLAGSSPPPVLANDGSATNRSCGNTGGTGDAPLDTPC